VLIGETVFLGQTACNDLRHWKGAVGLSISLCRETPDADVRLQNARAQTDTSRQRRRWRSKSPRRLAASAHGSRRCPSSWAGARCGSFNDCVSSTRGALQPLLVAVSKTKPNALLMEAYNAQQRHFGENYVS
jgi:hypothetical protein